MSKDSHKIGLGKGLSALLGDDEEEKKQYPLPDFMASSSDKEAIVKLEISAIISSKFQPRKDFAPEAIADLVNSVKEKGVLQPLLVRKTGEGKYELIAGERRLRAAKEAGLRFLPVIIKDFSDKETLEVALIENLQRENLNPLEEAEAYQRLAQEFGRTQEEIAKVIGKSRSYITNTLRLLSLPEEIKDMLKTGKLTAGHARNLIGVEDPVAMAKHISEQGLSVRETEALAGKSKEKKAGGKNAARKHKSEDEKSPVSDIAELEKACEDALGTSVKMKISSAGKGTITIDIASFEQLDDLIRILTAI